MEQKTQKKKVVTKGQYVGYLAKKTGLESFGSILCFFGIFGMILTSLGGTWLMLWMAAKAGGTTWNIAIQYAVALLILECVPVGIFALFWAIYNGGRALLGDSQKMDAVVPLNRYTVNRIPLEETLVRGSQQPSQQAETLLRAAQAEETPPEQLLRPEQGSQS